MVIHPVILSGGSGSRLWPLSREHFPKQLLPLVGEHSLLQATVSRIDGMNGVAAPLFVCNEEHRFLVAEQMRSLGRATGAILLEPVGRNTAPAATLAALTLKSSDPDAVMLLMPADHVIGDTAAFRAACLRGAELASQGNLVTFGIVPSSPETGYGYIRKGTAVTGAGLPAFKVGAFVEKPDAPTAKKYLDSGEYFWNSGIFMMTVKTWLEELKRHRGDIERACTQAHAGGTRDGDFFRVDHAKFGACPSDSIDYAVMEKTDRAVAVPLDAGWSDVGAWSSLWEVLPRDGNGNALHGDVLAQDTSNTLVHAQHRFVATVGVENLIVVETADAVLVVRKDRAQDVKKLVDALKSGKREEYKTHRKVYRPWGAYEGIDAGPRFQVKRITVNPGASLSLQMHHHRAEHWIVVKGTAKVTRGEDVFLLSENESTFIPLGTKHRLENPGAIPLEMIEVQSGSYLGEDDIVRFEDIYNRHQGN